MSKHASLYAYDEDSSSEESAIPLKLTTKRKEAPVDPDADASSDSDSDASSSSSSSSGNDKKKKKKKKKSKKKKTKKKKKKKKKHKKQKTKDSDDDEEQDAYSNKRASSKYVLTDQWGARGVISEADFHTKQDEFYAWLIEDKKTSRNDVSAKQERELFKQYVEDFNTCTLSEEKFYDMDKWRAANAKIDVSITSMSDEAKVRNDRQTQLRREAEAKEKLRVQAMVAALRNNPDSFRERQAHHRAVKPEVTLESIKLKRKIDKAEQRREARRKYK